MFILANILGAIAAILNSVIFFYIIILVVASLLSWVRPDPYNPLVRTLHALTQPVLWRVRKKLPFLHMGGLDLTPVVVILALYFINYALVQSLAELAVRLKISG